MPKHTPTRSDEEEFFKREEAEKKAKIRREEQLKAIRNKEQRDVATVLETSGEVAQEAMELGFDAETARVLPLVPLIQVAWADGRVTAAQAEKVEKKAEKFGIAPDTPAHEFLKLLLTEQPTSVFFRRVNLVIRAMVDEDPGGEIHSNVLAWSTAVAEASGGFFGLTDPISKHERKALAEIATHLDKELPD